MRVDLNDGFQPPEMTKRRPCIVLSPQLPHRPFLTTIVPLSATTPKTPQNYHLKLRLNPPLPHPYDDPEMWLKGDVVLTVSLSRLRRLFYRNDAGRKVWITRTLSQPHFARVQACVRAGLGL
jgi:uncharacterized protein YifN (PemK superfamily)